MPFAVVDLSAAFMMAKLNVIYPHLYDFSLKLKRRDFVRKMACGLFVFFSSFSLCAVSMDLPEVIDFGCIEKMQFSEFSGNGIENEAFNKAPELCSFFMYLKDTYQIDTVFETGTYYGFTTAAFALMFNQVYTVEVVKSIYISAQHNLCSYKNITQYLGSSDLVLKRHLPALKDKRVLFYLDAHWYDKWPLLNEINEISKTHKDNCIIVIDDFKVPGRSDIDYDKYGSNECSCEYIQEALGRVFSDCSYHFIIPENVGSHAKFVAIPKKWAN